MQSCMEAWRLGERRAGTYFHSGPDPIAAHVVDDNPAPFGDTKHRSSERVSPDGLSTTVYVRLEAIAMGSGKDLDCSRSKGSCE